MKVTFVGHASILVEAGGMTVLSDPWWRGPCFGAQWWNYPFADLACIESRKIDYIYISHGHHDHLHPGTLNTLSRDAKVLISARTGLTPTMRELGFEVIEIGYDEPAILGDGALSCRIMETHAGDTLMTLTDGKEVCVNLNDALHSAPASVQRDFAERLRAIYPTIDYVFCGYGVASHFPNCYVIPGKDRAATAVRRQEYFNGQWAGLIAALQPKYGFPFAADVAYLEEDLFWLNESAGKAERPTATFDRLYPGSEVQTRDIAPGFVIQDGAVTVDKARQPIISAALQEACAEQIARANRHGTVSQSDVDEVAQLLEANLKTCAGYLRSYKGSYRFLIRFHNSPLGICIDKAGRRLRVWTVKEGPGQSYDLIYTTRLAYLKWSLTREHAHEILFVGSGGIFQFPVQAPAKENLQRELMPVLRKQDVPMRSRYGNRPRFIVKLKQAVKTRFGMRQPDLYDLSEWTVFETEARKPGQLRRQAHAC